MLILKMLPRTLHRSAGVVAAVLLSFAAFGCEKVPLLAPTGSTITLTASTNVLSANGTAPITVHVLEAAGTAPHSGTRVTFTTTLGRIEPAEVATDISGRATVTFVAGGANGTATISAISGGATTGTTGVVKIAIGTAAVGIVLINASPSSVPSTGGSTTVTAVVLDSNGNPLSGTAVVFTTTTGSLSPAVATTAANGAASTVLTTTQTAKVTASVGPPPPAGTGTPAGVATASVDIPVTSAPLISITPPAAPSKGLPATFTFTVTPAAQNGSAVRSVVVSWGDGKTENLGSITGAQQASHVFTNDGTFTVSATVTDVAGGTNTASTSIVVIPVPRPGIVVQLSSSVTAPKVVTVSFQITLPSGLGIRETLVDFDDGTKQSFGGAASATFQHTYATGGLKTVVVSVLDTSGETTSGYASITLPLP